MVFTAHNSIFGWIHGFRFNSNNVLSGKPTFSDTPYYPIIANPSANQILYNWNIADTGVTIATIIASALVAFPLSRSISSNFRARNQFYQSMTFGVIAGIILGARNSYYRL